MNKPILYCSLHCDHSKELLKYIKAKSIIDNFNIYIIENETKKLPAFVDRVPLMFHNNKMLFDEGLFIYINSIKSQREEINPFTVESSISDTYSFIDSENGLDHSYLNVNSTGNFEDQKIETPQESSQTDKVDLEQIINQREKDMKS
jgi:hypothetical protein